MAHQLWIPGPLPGLNELIASAKSRAGRWSAYGAVKGGWTETVKWLSLKGPRFKRVFIEFEWREKNRRRDPDNITGAGHKLILDGLVKGGMLPNDGWDAIEGWTDRWTVDPRPGVLLTIHDRG